MTQKSERDGQDGEPEPFDTHTDVSTELATGRVSILLSEFMKDQRKQALWDKIDMSLSIDVHALSSSEPVDVLGCRPQVWRLLCRGR